jgi:hypothetical protein
MTMQRRFKMITTSLLTVSLAALQGLGCSGDGDSTPATCTALTSYTPSTSNFLSFATDIYPILSDTNIMNGCSQVTICHGNPPSGLDDLLSPTKTMQFLYSPPDMARARQNLMTASVNAPTMQVVAPGNVGQSFMAYKISDRNTLACVNSKCVAGASVGNNQPCGDPMPSGGNPLTAEQRTKILDWIAQGAGS